MQSCQLEDWRDRLETIRDYLEGLIDEVQAQESEEDADDDDAEDTGNQRTAPNWDDFQGQRMTIPLFVYGREDIDVGPLMGFCRGHGAISGNEKSYQDTPEGVYYNILVDTRLECAVPQFFIEDKGFSYPIVACFTVGGGLPVIDPATGNMKQPKATTNEGIPNDS